MSTLSFYIIAAFLIAVSVCTTVTVTAPNTSVISSLLTPPPFRCERDGIVYKLGEVFTDCHISCICSPSSWQCFNLPRPTCRPLCRSYAVKRAYECNPRCYRCEPPPTPPQLTPMPLPTPAPWCSHFDGSLFWPGQSYRRDQFSKCTCKEIDHLHSPEWQCYTLPLCVLPNGTGIPYDEMTRLPILLPDPNTFCRCNFSKNSYQCITHSCKAPDDTTIAPGKSYSPFPYTTCHCNQSDPLSNVTMECVVNPVPTTVTPAMTTVKSSKLKVSPPLVGKRILEDSC